MITYENTKPLYDRLGLKPGYGSFIDDAGYACPVSIHKLSESPETLTTGKPYSDELLSFAWGFDRSPEEGTPHNKLCLEYYKAGKALRERFEADGKVPNIYDIRDAANRSRFGYRDDS